MAEITFDQVLGLAEQLTFEDRNALIESLQAVCEQEAEAEWGQLIDQMAGGADDDPM